MGLLVAYNPHIQRNTTAALQARHTRDFKPYIPA